MGRERSLVILAWANALLHGLGLVAAVVGMRPGTGAVPLDARLAYLAQRPLGWTFGWTTWALCAIALVAFVAELRARATDPSTASVRTLGLALVLVGAAVDLSCDALWITLVPELAREGATPLFFAVARGANVGGAVVANGLYSLAVVILSRSVRQGALWAYATFAWGLGMVFAGLNDVPAHMEWVTGPTVVSFVGWALSVAHGELSPETARAVERPEPSP